MKKKAKIEDFLVNEQSKKNGYTKPVDRPSDTKIYYDSPNENILQICPEYVMVHMGLVCGQFCGFKNFTKIPEDFNTIGDFFEFFDNQITFGYPAALLGLLGMAKSSNVLVSHLGPAYYLGSYICE